MRIGVGLPSTGSILDAARHAESAGIDAVGIADVLVGDGTPVQECIVTLSAAAAVTERVWLDIGVVAVPTRPLAMLAAQVQTLQRLSGGRVRLGLGIGGFAGSPFWTAVGAPSSGRGRLLDEALTTLPALIAGAPNPLGVVLAPGSAVPPLMVGGSAIDAVLRRAARHADVWLPSALTPAQIGAAAQRLRGHAEEYGRPAPRIQVGMHAAIDDEPARARTAGELAEFFGLSPEQVAEVMLHGSVAHAAEQVAAYADAGADELSLALDGSDHRRQLDLVAEVRARV